MKFWTVQKKEIVDLVKRDGIFFADFNKSDYIKLKPSIKELYYTVLESFNRINQENLLGMIYASCQDKDGYLCEIDSFDKFYLFIQSKKAVIESLWKELRRKEAIIKTENIINTYSIFDFE